VRTSPWSLLLLLAIGVQSWAALPEANQNNLSIVLDSEGRMQAGAGNGSFDASGYELVSRSGEAPRFAPAKAGSEKYFGVGYGCNADVSGMALGADRRIYLVGAFTYCGDAVTRHVAVYDPRSGRFSALGEGVNAPASQISISGNDVYISGSFTQAGDAPALRLARWDGQRWSSPGNISYPHAALAAVPGGVYVGAAFTEIDGLIVNNIAYWKKDGGEWQALGSGDAVGTDGAVRALAVGSDGLYVAGRLNLAGGIAVNSIARWDGQRWFDVGGGLIPPGVFDEPVAAMAAQGRDVYVTGFYTLTNHSAVRNIARWDGQAWHAVGDPAQITSRGFRLAVSGREIFATGLLDGQIAHFDGSAWSVFSGYYGLSPNAPGAMLMADSSLYLGGDFYAAGGVYAENIVRWNGAAYSALSHGAPRVANGAISVVSVVGANVYIGGRFTEVDGVPAIGIARWNGSRWSAVGAGLDFGATFSLIDAIAEYAGQLYVAGQFTLVDGLTVNNIVRWDGVRWQTVGSGEDSGTNAPVKALAEYAGELYVAGAFTRAGSASARGIARWNGQRWEALGTGINMPDNGFVSGLVPMASGLMVSGSFTLAGGQSARYVARWDGSAWSGIEPINELGLFSAPLLASSGTDLVLAGERVNVNGYAYEVNRWNGVNLTPVGTLPILDISLRIRALAAAGPDIYLRGDSGGGRFGVCCTTAHWDGGSWAPFYDPSPRAAQAAERIPLAMDGDVLSVNAYDLRASALPTRISQPATGGDANGASGQVALSADGLRVVYRSDASNLAGSAAGVFLRDRVSGIQTRLSTAVEALDPSLQQSHGSPAISGDGQVTALAGSAGQVYRISQGQAEIASRAIDGSGGNGASGNPRLNADGSRMVFDSRASNLVADDGNGSLSDVFLRDFASASTTLISRTADASPGNGPSIAPSASDDGVHVAFETSASNLSGVSGASSQIVLSQRNGSGRQLWLISRNPVTGEAGNGPSRGVRLTPDGRFGVFVSAASNLVAGDSNGVDDVFLFELGETGLTRLQRVSLGPQGNQANAASADASINADGSYVVFASDASNLVLLDRNQHRDVFVKNIATGEVLRMSASADGQVPTAPSSAPWIAGDGAGVAFVSAATNLVANDLNGVPDVYWASLRKPDTQAPGPGVDEPGAAHFTLPAPSPPFANCPAGYFTATVDDGPGVGLTPGLFGMALELDPGGSQRLDGGLNFGGLIDKSQAGFAGVNIYNDANEPQKLTINLSGFAFDGNRGSLPIQVRVLRQPAPGVDELVYERRAVVSMDVPLIDELVIQPGYYVVTVLPDETAAGEPGGAAEGQIFFQLGTRFVDRVGGGFFAGVVVGGYHAAHPEEDVSGFAAFCLATPHSATVRSLSAPSYGIGAARDLRVQLLDDRRRPILVLPSL
jgi:trimeric autotransporter adhesin